MNKRTTIIATGLALCIQTFAQGLHKEINVEQEIVPVKREASRITVLPTLNLPPINRPQLSFSDRVVTARVPNSISTLDPVAFGDKLYTSPYRGYLVLGLGAPLFNATLSAGYRAMDNDKTRLSLWTQYNGDIYRKKETVIGGTSHDVTNYWRDHSASIGADLHQAVGKTSYLDAGIDYTYGYHTAPVGHLSYSQNISRLNASAVFTGTGSGPSYSTGLKYNHFGFYHFDMPDGYGYKLDGYPETGTRQNLFSALAKATLPFGDTSSLGLDINADFLHTGYHLTPVYPYNDEIKSHTAGTTGLISLSPYFDFRTSTLTGHIGAQIDVAVNDGKVFHISPEVSVAWIPSQIIGFEIKAKGGSELNTLASLYDITPYINSFMAYNRSYIPYALDGQVTIGPFLGAYLNFFGGYAKADEWLMPTGTNIYAGEGVFTPVDLSAWHLGSTVGYDFRRLLSIRASYETAPNDYDHSYYEWRDRAKHVVNAELKIRPIEPLLLSLGWEFRSGRRAYAFRIIEVHPELGNIYESYVCPLGVASNLSFGAGYNATDALTIFARGENLLNRHYSHIGLRPSQGINFIIGASLKF